MVQCVEQTKPQKFFLWPIALVLDHVGKERQMQTLEHRQRLTVFNPNY